MILSESLILCPLHTVIFCDTTLLLSLIKYVTSPYLLVFYSNHTHFQTTFIGFKRLYFQVKTQTCITGTRIQTMIIQEVKLTTRPSVYWLLWQFQDQQELLSDVQYKQLIYVKGFINQLIVHKLATGTLKQHLSCVVVFVVTLCQRFTTGYGCSCN